MDWNQSLHLQAQTLSNLVDHLNPLEVAAALTALSNCKGLRYFTGVGKNALVAAKVASTFSSLGLRSIFIDPVHAVHGDMGLFCEDDLLVAISNSGATSELMTFIKALKNLGFINIFGVHSKPKCTLASASRNSLYIPILSEGDHLGIAPVGSSVAYMAVLQAFAVHISSSRYFTTADFVRTHPGGTLGTIPVQSEIKHVIVQAGGRGSRMQHLTNLKPKCLVSIQGKPMLYHLFDRFPDATFYVIGDYQVDTLQKYLSTFPPSVQVRLVQTSEKGTCAGIQQARDLLPTANTPFALIWSDLMLTATPQLPSVNANYIGIADSLPCRWSFKQGSLVEATEIGFGVMGFFYFATPLQLPAVPLSGEFVKFLRDQQTVLQPWTIKEAVEIGSLEAYQHHSQGPVVRFFNQLTIKDQKVIKEPRVDSFKQLIGREVLWYQKMHELQFPHAPQLLKVDPLTIQYIPGAHPFELDLQPAQRETLLMKMIDTLAKLHSLASRPCQISDMRQEYLTKTIERFQKVKGMFKGFYQAEYKINGRSVPNFLHEKHLGKLEEIFTHLPQQNFTVIHGDPTFSNMLVDKDLELWLIDPRGYFGEQVIYGDPNYDFYKLFYSVVGNYDAFNRRQFVISIDGQGANLTIPPSPWQCLENHFLAQAKLDKRAVYLAHGLIWVALSGYAIDDVDSIYGAFFKGLEVLASGYHL